MKENSYARTQYSLGIIGAVLILLGTIFPTMFAIFLRPKQPPWESAAVFVEHYDVIQSLPFYFGSSHDPCFSQTKKVFKYMKKPSFFMVSMFESSYTLVSDKEKE